LGAEFSRQLADKGLNLAMVSLEDGDLKTLARQLETQHRIETHSVVGDITSPEVLARLTSATETLEVGLVVYNAGLAVSGLWLNTPLSQHLEMIDLNVRGPLTILDNYVPAMAQRGRGGVILLSSMSGLQGSPVVATYAATKAFTLNLAESLWDEWRSLGVDVTALIPGPTDTPGYRNSAPRTTRLTPKAMDVEPVVSQALNALGSRLSVVPGRTNKIGGFLLSRMLPRRVSVAFMGRTMRHMYPSDIATVVGD